MERDLYSNIKSAVALDPAAIVTDTTTVGNIIDSQGFESITFLVYTKAVTDGVYAFKIEQGDDSGLSDAADVPAANVLGALTGFISTDDDAVKRFGVTGKKRYFLLSIVSTATTIGADIIGAVAVLGHPRSAPIAQ